MVPFIHQYLCRKPEDVWRNQLPCWIYSTVKQKCSCHRSDSSHQSALGEAHVQFWPTVCVCVGYMFDRVALLQVFSSSTLVFTCIISAVFHIHLVIHLPLTLCHLNSWHCCQITHTNETKICATAGCITGKVTDMYLVAEHCWYNRDSDCWRQLEAVLHCPSCI